MNRRTKKSRGHKQDVNLREATAAHAWDPVRPEGGAKYESLVEAIADGVKSGALQAGTRLPPQRELARLFNCTIATVTKAIGLAARRGLVVTRTGSGTFVKGASANDETGDAQRPAFFDLSLNSPPVAIAAPLLQRCLKALTDAESAQMVAADKVKLLVRNTSVLPVWGSLNRIRRICSG